MSVLLRDTFVELHSQDILGKLRQEVRVPLTISLPSSDASRFVGTDHAVSLRDQFIARYHGHVVPVAKIPAGLRSVAPGDPIPAPPSPTDLEASTATSDSNDNSDVSAVISELEEEDGSDSLSIFAQSKKVKRASSPVSGPWDDGAAEDEDGISGSVWKLSPKKTDSKLVYLADVLPRAPSKGDFDLNLVRSSPYLYVSL